MNTHAHSLFKNQDKCQMKFYLFLWHDNIHIDLNETKHFMLYDSSMWIGTRKRNRANHAIRVTCSKHTCRTDFRKIRDLDACSKYLSTICFTLFNPNSSPSFKHSDDRGMRITVESKDDQGIFSSISIGLNWSRNRSVKLVPAITEGKNGNNPIQSSIRKSSLNGIA